MKYKIYSWNVNGIRATAKKGLFWPWLQKSDSDIVCLQETKATADQLDQPLVEPMDYTSYWHSAEKKGYSGVASFVRTSGKKKKTLNSTEESIGVEEFDKEGRVIITKFDDFTLLNVYFPNGKKNQERLDYKMRFYKHFLQFCQELRKNREKIVICGDVNTAHTEVDLENHKQNEKQSGFLPIERAWMDKLIESGYIDTYRHLYPEKFDKGQEKLGGYTWWSMRSKTAKINNVGWRLDYFFISEDLIENLKSAAIHPEKEGSDHCPISIELEF
ncbi:MAG: exodeoxyribonuclease III [Candidatus Heimdallarchaeota archaeon]|nr:exodeoxyribonuclease III [Candidatus Heimdallarchaeota archaeon]